MTSTGDIAAIIRAVIAALPTDALHTAKNVADESADRLRWATNGTNHEAPQAALGHITEGISHTEEALQSLEAITERLNAYLAVLAPGNGSSGPTSNTSTTNAPTTQARPPRPIAGPAGKGPINPPNKRHDLNKIGKSARPDDVNTIILPGTDVDGDLTAIRRGDADWLGDRSRYEVNERLYGVEPHGTVFPDSGPGFIKLSRSEYQALKGVIQARGDMDNLPPTLTNNPSISEADWHKAAEVYKHHKHYRTEGTG